MTDTVLSDHLPTENSPTPAAPRSGGIASALLNVITILLLLGTVLSCAGFAALFSLPSLIPTALRPPEIAELPPTAFIPTSTATSIVLTLPPAWTATPTPAPSDTPLPTDTPPPSSTSTPTATPTETPGPTATGPTPTATRTLSAQPYTLQGDAPVPLSNFANNEGCNWMGIAGQVFGANDEGVPGIIVHLEGGGDPKDTPTGSKPEYGSAGYEFVLGNHPVDTSGVYRVQLRNPDGSPLSDVVVVNTFADCSKNLLLVNFVRNH